MAVRIINMVCPKCKHGIKHDTLTDTTTSMTVDEYPVKNEAGRYWCKRCQHGTNANEDGLCEECAEKGMAVRLVAPTSKKEAAPLADKEVEVNNNVITLDKTGPSKPAGPPTKKVIGITKKSSGSTS